MVIFAYIFGWRESTITTLSRADVWISDSHICFHESFCKGFQKLSGNPYRNVWFQASNFPFLLDAFTAYLRVFDATATSDDLWRCSPSDTTLDAALKRVLNAIDSD